jgi:GNAT superfamily N-acetyltransferase
MRKAACSRTGPVDARVSIDARLLIRPFRAADHDACASIYVRARVVAFPWRPAPSFALADFARDSQDETILVAERGGEVIGFLSICPDERFIHLLFVDPDQRRTGVGRRLLAHALDVLGPRVWLKCQQKNLPALAFYRSQGWSVTPGGADEVGPWSYVASPAASRTAT